MRLKDKVVIITGAARGLAEKAARLMAAEGALLVAGDRDIARLRDVVQSIEAGGGRAVAVEVDITRKPMVDNLAKEALDRHGRIDALVTCGAGYRHYHGMIETSEDEWDFIVDSNLKSAFLCCQAVLPAMVKQRSGRILNVSSLAARTWSYFLGAHYSAAKAGVLGLTRHLAHEFGPLGICVNALTPTAFRGERLSDLMTPEQEKALTALIPLGRIPEADDIAPVIAFMVSDEARFISGATIDVNGAMVTA